MGALTLLWVLPAFGGLFCLLLPGPRRAALAFAAATGALLAWLAAPIAAGPAGGYAEVSAPWIFGIRYSLSLDGLSLPLAGLTALLTMACLVHSWKRDYPAGYWACLMFLESALLGVFLARDLFIFYVFWEAVLVPMSLLIGIWGSEGRRHAALKFFVYTFGGSLLLLVGILALVTSSHGATGVWNWDMASLQAPSGRSGLLVFLSLAVGLGVKIPLVPMHTWLPDAHTEAPAAGSVMLAGLLLKMGVYGFLRLLLPVFTELCWALLPWLGVVALVNIAYGSVCAMAQRDLKRVVACSSVAHMGFCMLGLASRTPEGVSGAALQMINHGLTTGTLFLLVGCLYERSHRRGLGDFGGLARRAPWLTFFFGFSIMASAGVPGLNGFVGEFMAIAGMARAYPGLALLAAGGALLSAAYALPAFQAVFWSEPGPRSVSGIVSDLDGRERALVGSLCALMLVLGLYPAPLLRILQPAVWSVLAGVQPEAANRPAAASWAGALE